MPPFGDNLDGVYAHLVLPIVFIYWPLVRDNKLYTMCPPNPKP